MGAHRAARRLSRLAFVGALAGAAPASLAAQACLGAPVFDGELAVVAGAPLTRDVPRVLQANLLWNPIGAGAFTAGVRRAVPREREQRFWSLLGQAALEIAHWPVPMCAYTGLEYYRAGALEGVGYEWDPDYGGYARWEPGRPADQGLLLPAGLAVSTSEFAALAGFARVEAVIVYHREDYWAWDVRGTAAIGVGARLGRFHASLTLSETGGAPMPYSVPTGTRVEARLMIIL